MRVRSNVFDLWTFHRGRDGVVRYLLLRTSQAKADKWFGGSRFWQIPGDFFPEDRDFDLLAALRGALDGTGLVVVGLHAVDHVSSYYNRRRRNIEFTATFAAEVREPLEIPLTWENDEQDWFNVEECLDRLGFRGLREGLEWTRRLITEATSPDTIYRLD